MRVLVRCAQEQDYDDVGRITAAAYLAGGFLSPDDEYLAQLSDAAHRAQHAQLWVAELDRRIVGAVTVAPAGSEYAEMALPGEVEFRMLAVDPQLQRAGVGRAMVQAVIDYARTQPAVTAVSLSSMTGMLNAHRLYEDLGFARVPARDWTVPGHDIRLWAFRCEL